MATWLSFVNNLILTNSLSLDQEMTIYFVITNTRSDIQKDASASILCTSQTSALTRATGPV
jgi:hypothetical protein